MKTGSYRENYYMVRMTEVSWRKLNEIHSELRRYGVVIPKARLLEFLIIKYGDDAKQEIVKAIGTRIVS